MSDFKLNKLWTLLLFPILIIVVVVFKRQVQNEIKDTSMEKYEINNDSIRDEILIKLRYRHDSIRASFVEKINISNGTNDTLLLGYICGSTRKEVDMHTKSLVSSKKLSYTSARIPWEEKPTFVNNVPTYRLYINPNKFIDYKLSFPEDPGANNGYGSLEKIQLRPEDGFIADKDEQMLIKYLSQIYGEPYYFEDKKGPFWFYKNNEISTIGFDIVFENLAFKKKCEYKKAVQDSLRREANLIKTKSSQDDLR